MKWISFSTYRIRRGLIALERVPAIFSRPLGLIHIPNNASAGQVVSSALDAAEQRTPSRFLPSAACCEFPRRGSCSLVTKLGEVPEQRPSSMARKKRRSSDPSEEDVQEERDNGAGDQNDLYKVLGVERTATQEEIRKAYHKLALRLHPDKNPDDEGAKEKFQSLQSVIAILGDPEKRKVYDDTGSVEDVELSGDSFKNVYQFFRALYKQITEEDIDSFAESYRGSEVETADLKNEYKSRKGNMELVFTYLMCSDPSLDSHRFMEIIDAAISAGELKEYKVYRKWAEATAKLPAPSNPLAPTNRKKKSRKASGDGPLALIAKRSKAQMDSLVSALEAKYGGKRKGKKGSSAMPDEPSEEEFQAAQARVMDSHDKTSSRANKTSARATEARRNNKRKSGKLD